ncbi:MliC family protein [Rubellimicrobium aerolatum]|uniref:MliC family protein n=1 Tax=Rubellimicrobium aerolatum TaxID=490979 RepID=A0ABW0SAZ4_9RHOB
MLRYSCEDGRVVDAAFLALGDRDLAVLSLDGAEPALLTIAASASGARYVGAGLQWWGKGQDEAMLAPLAEGEDIASAAGTTCRADQPATP